MMFKTVPSIFCIALLVYGALAHPEPIPHPETEKNLDVGNDSNGIMAIFSETFL